MRDDAETLLQALGEFVRAGFHRCTVEAVADVLRFTPLSCLPVQELHDSDAEVVTDRIGVTDALHPVHALTKSCVA